MRLHFYGAAQVVTGSNYLLETDNVKILIDCGMFQGAKHVEDKNYEDFPCSPREIDYLHKSAIKAIQHFFSKESGK